MRQHSYPDGHWSLAVDIPYSMGVRHDDLIMLCGQADLVGSGEVGHPYDLSAQTEVAIGHIRTLFHDLNATLEDLVKLTVFYVNNGEVDQSAYVEAIGQLLGTTARPVIAMVKFPRFSGPLKRATMSRIRRVHNGKKETQFQ